MKQTVYLYDFQDAFNRVRPNNFSREGQEVLFNYLEQYEDDTGEEIELDVIALCCDYEELSLSDLLKTYDDITDEELTDDNEAELLGLATDYLESQTMLCGVTPQNTFVFAVF